MHLKNYLIKTKNQANTIINELSDDIVDVASFIGDVMSEDGLIQLFSLGHDYALNMELGYRAGGLVQYHQIGIRDLMLRGVISEEEVKADNFYERDDLVDKIWETFFIDDRDAFLIYAANKVEKLALEVAKKAKANNHKLVVIVAKEAVLLNSKEYSEELFTLADKLVDLKIPNPDIGYEVEGYKVTQIANLIVNLFAQSMTMEIYTYLKSIGKDIPVLWSANISGADEHNKKITKKYEGRWNA